MRRRTLLRAVVILLLSPLFWMVVAPPVRQAQREQGDADFARTIRPFLTSNCYQCHNAKLNTGGLNLEAYQTAASVMQNHELWGRVLQKLKAGEMPPEGMPRPNPAELKLVVGWIENELGRATAQSRPDPGRVTAHRLNRVEYNNTIRDLLGVDSRPADDFPQDDSGYGFDNIGDVLSISPGLMEKYLSTGEKIARTAVFGSEILKPTVAQHRPRGRRIVTNAKVLFDYDRTGLSLPNSLHATHRFPVSGEYVMRVSLGGTRPAGSEPLPLAVWIDGKQVQAIDFDPTGVASFSNDRQDFAGMTQDFRTKVDAGDHWVEVSILRLYEGLPAGYAGPNPSKRAVPPRPEFRLPPGIPSDQIEEFKKRFEERRREIVPANDARIDLLEVRGPYVQVTGPSADSLRKIYVCGHLNGNHQPGCARKIVANLAHRAFRRPVAPQEVDRLASLAAMARGQGGSFEEGISVAIQAILVSPHFIFRIEKDNPTAGPDDAHPISQHELASRLSYFLWSSMPDDELLRAADQHQLSDQEVLAAQVRRMLKDPKARALAENFGGQWLELRKLESVKPDRERFPDFEEYLRMSMRRETELFFENIVREDRSILDFIDADYSFLNERLAQIYKIPGVTGPEFRRVNLSGTHRGGVLTQASVLTVSSYATRTSPVLRGKWILENLLNAPPPPPPADVPNLNEAAIGSSASLRQQMEQHRKNPTCASCHLRMDALGFGLENYDAIGAWRTLDGKFPIDASGSLPDGSSFNGPEELRVILKADRAGFAECLTEKLLTYALGRGVESYDKPTVKAVAGRVAADDYRFSRLILEIVKSVPFQMRRGDPVK